MNPDYPWMWHWGGMWFFPMIIFFILIFFLFFVFGRARCRSHWWGPCGYHGEKRESESALEILKKRYAKGEITKEEFEQMKKDILS